MRLLPLIAKNRTDLITTLPLSASASLLSVLEDIACGNRSRPRRSRTSQLFR
jgi:hypothetical protein